jgi:hypothetical protein
VLTTVPSIQSSIQIAHRELTDLLEIIRQIAKYGKSNPDERLAFYKALHNIDEEIARQAMEHEWPYLDFNEQIDVDGL